MNQRSMTRILFGLLLLCLVSTTFAKWSPQEDLRFELRYNAGYDNNFLRLSEADLDEFKANNLNWETTPQSYDDLVQEVGVNFAFKSPEIANRVTRLYYTVSYKSYSRNSFNDYLNHSLFMIQDVSKRIDMVGSYFFIPERYLRDYYDRDYGEVYPTNFAYHLGSIGFRYTQPYSWRFEARYEGFQVLYNGKFTEYDSDGWGYRLYFRKDITKSFRAFAEVRQRWSDNFGFEDTQQFINTDLNADAEYGDGTYGEEWYELGFSYELPPILSHDFDLNVSHRLRHRYYTTDNPLETDRFHRGREHDHHLFSLSLEGDLGSAVSGGPWFAYEWRRTNSPVDRVPEVKDYDAIEFGVRFDITLYGF
ncbi:hypothetical protein K8I28_03655 [bacterium]|nr:hypothetical protein [bacterium]